MPIRFSAAALADLQRIAPAAHPFWQRLQSLQQDPLQFRERNDLFPGCRIASHRKDVILFRMQQDQLEVVRIIHRSLNPNRHATRN